MFMCAQPGSTDKTHAQQIPAIFCEAPACLNNMFSLTLGPDSGRVSAEETLQNHIKGEIYILCNV